MIHETFVPGHPRTQGSLHLARNPATGKEFARYSGPTIEWRGTLYVALSHWWGTAPAIEAPCLVRLGFVFPRPKVHWRTTGAVKDSAPVHMTAQMDLDKLCRAVLDGLTEAHVWLDDSQCVDLFASKRYQGAKGEQPGCRIRVEAVA